MKFWFFSSDGVIVMLVVISLAFCGDLPADLDLNASNKTMEIPCSLDDVEGNSTDCRNVSQVSDTSSQISRENLTSTSCPPEGCSADYEPEKNASSLTSSGTTLTTLSETDNLMENTTATEYFSNETTTCSPEECSEILPESEPTILLKTNITENNVTADHFTVATIPSKEIGEDNNTFVTETTNETVSSTTDVSELTSVELYNNSYSGNASMTSHDLNITTWSTTFSTNFSSQMEENFTEELSTNSSANTITPFIITNHREENNTVTNEPFYTEPDVMTTTDNFSHASEINNSTENITVIESLDTTTLQTITDENNVSVTRPIDESFDNITKFVDNTTTDIYLATSTHTLQDLANFTSTLDNYTLFYTMPSSLNSSDASTETSTLVVTEEKNSSFDTSSDSLIDTTTISSNDLTTSTPPYIIYLVVEIRINCSQEKKEKEIAMSVAQLLNATLKDDYHKDCSNLHNITLSMFQNSSDFATIYSVLSQNLKDAKLIRVIYDENSANITSKNITLPDSDVTEREMVLYVTLGVCLGAIFLIALVIICFKCCRRRPSKPIDLDVPHLNLRLEDYTLTRIPRPNTVYLDYFRGPIVSDRYSSAPLGNSMNAATEADRGMVQPFDTSVVPLEDAKKLDHQLATSPGRTSSTCPSTPLRTFGRKDWKRGDNLIYENVISSSTEKLHPDFYKYGYPGMENPTFAA